MPTSSTERRLHPRHHPCGKAQIECRRGVPGAGPNLFDSLVDLSPVGMGLVTCEPLERRDRVEIALVEEGAEPLRWTAEVVWTKPIEKGRHLVGLFFLRTLSEAEMERLS